MTAAVVERLEAGTPGRWVQPWTGAAARPLRVCGTPCQGINVLWLWIAAEAAGQASRFRMTSRECAHELSHWTGHESPLAPQMGGRFGSEVYGMEELVAELSSAFLGAELGLPVSHLDHHASYLASWLKVLKADNRAILTVAAKAEEAASLLLRLAGREASGASAGDALAEPHEALAA